MEEYHLLSSTMVVMILLLLLVLLVEIIGSISWADKNAPANSSCIACDVAFCHSQLLELTKGPIFCTFDRSGTKSLLLIVGGLKVYLDKSLMTIGTFSLLLHVSFYTSLIILFSALHHYVSVNDIPHCCESQGYRNAAWRHRNSNCRCTTSY